MIASELLLTATILIRDLLGDNVGVIAARPQLKLKTLLGKRLLFVTTSTNLQALIQASRLDFRCSVISYL